MTRELVMSEEKKDMLDGICKVGLPIIVSGKNEETVSLIIEYISRKYNFLLIDEEQYERHINRGLFSNKNKIQFVMSSKLIEPDKRKEMNTHIKLLVVPRKDPNEFFLSASLIEVPNIIKVDLNGNNTNAVIVADSDIPYKVTLLGKKDYASITVDSHETHDLMLDIHKARLLETLVQQVKNYKSAGIKPLLITLDTTYFDENTLADAVEVLESKQEQTGIFYIVKINNSIEV